MQTTILRETKGALSDNTKMQLRQAITSLANDYCWACTTLGIR